MAEKGGGGGTGQRRQTRRRMQGARFFKRTAKNGPGERNQLQQKKKEIRKKRRLSRGSGQNAFLKGQTKGRERLPGEKDERKAGNLGRGLTRRRTSRGGSQEIEYPRRKWFLKHQKGWAGGGPLPGQEAHCCTILTRVSIRVPDIWGVPSEEKDLETKT